MKSISKANYGPLVLIGLFAVAGLILLAITRAATGSLNLEVEDFSAELKKSDELASGSSYIEFNGTEPVDDPIAGHNGDVGCKEGCETLGFQNLDGKDGVTIENKIITNPGGKCISMNGAKNITLRHVTVENCATQVTLSGSGSGHNPIIPVMNANNITIENSIFKNISRVEATRNRNNLFAIESTSNFTFRNNEVRDLHNDLNAGGAFGGGGASDFGNRLFRIVGSSSNIKIERNSLFNPGRNVLQIVRTTIPGFLLAHNRIEGRGEWDSSFEDIINFYEASGTAASPLTVRGNYIRNGGPSINGTGMIMGDGGGGLPRYMLVEDNVLLNPGKVGIGISGGTNFTVRNNIILNDIDIPNIHPNMADAVGMHIHKFPGYTPECRDHVVTGNRIYYKNQLAASGVNHLWNPKTCSNVDLSGTVVGDTTLKRENIWPF